MKGPRSVGRRLAPLAAAVLATGALQVMLTGTAYAIPAGGAVNQHYGFDTCSAPSTAAMSTWYVDSPYWWIGIYIGGNSRACAQPNLSAAWLNTTYGQGWRFAPLWVGPQAPCTTYYNRFSSNTSTAFQQGKNEAISAWYALVNLGFGSNAAQTPIYYDLENYSPPAAPGWCQTAVSYFIAGWVSQLHIIPAQVAGVYGSTCASYLNNLATISPPPDDIWGGDGSSHTSSMSCINSGYWTQSQRLEQYSGGHVESYGGVAINIDNDCANGWLAPTTQYGTDQACL